MPTVVRIPAAKGEMIEAFASDIHQKRVQMLLAHGEHEATTFKVPEHQIIVFVAEAGKRLPQTIIRQEFYDIFASKSALRKLLMTRSEDLPWFMRGWVKRTYGPGDVCPETYLELKDPCWQTAMGIHSLPLAYPLRSPKQFAGKNATLREVAKAKAIWSKRCGTNIDDPTMFFRSTGRDAEPRTGAGNGSTVRLSELTGAGVLFVFACREIKRADKARLEAMNRLAAPVDEEKRRRRTIANRDDNERARPGKRVKTVNTSNFLRQAQERREKLERLKVLNKRIQARK